MFRTPTSTSIRGKSIAILKIAFPFHFFDLLVLTGRHFNPDSVMKFLCGF